MVFIANYFSRYADDVSRWTQGPALSGCLRSVAQRDHFSGGDFARGSLVFFAGCRSRFEGENPFASLVPRFFVCLDHQVCRDT